MAYHPPGGNGSWANHPPWIVPVVQPPSAMHPGPVPPAMMTTVGYTIPQPPPPLTAFVPPSTQPPHVLMPTSSQAANVMMQQPVLQHGHPHHPLPVMPPTNFHPPAMLAPARAAPIPSHTPSSGSQMGHMFGYTQPKQSIPLLHGVPNKLISAPPSTWVQQAKTASPILGGLHPTTPSPTAPIVTTPSIYPSNPSISQASSKLCMSEPPPHVNVESDSAKVVSQQKACANITCTMSDPGHHQSEAPVKDLFQPQQATVTERCLPSPTEMTTPGLYRRFAERLNDGAREATDEKILSLFISLSGAERKQVLQKGSIRAFLASCPYIHVSGNKLSLIQDRYEAALRKQSFADEIDCRGQENRSPEDKGNSISNIKDGFSLSDQYSCTNGPLENESDVFDANRDFADDDFTEHDIEEAEPENSLDIKTSNLNSKSETFLTQAKDTLENGSDECDFSDGNFTENKAKQPQPENAINIKASNLNWKSETFLQQTFHNNGEVAKHSTTEMAVNLVGLDLDERQSSLDANSPVFVPTPRSADVLNDGEAKLSPLARVAPTSKSDSFSPSVQSTVTDLGTDSSLRAESAEFYPGYSAEKGRDSPLVNETAWSTDGQHVTNKLEYLERQSPRLRIESAPFVPKDTSAKSSPLTPDAPIFQPRFRHTSDSMGGFSPNTMVDEDTGKEHSDFHSPQVPEELPRRESDGALEYAGESGSYEAWGSAAPPEPQRFSGGPTNMADSSSPPVSQLSAGFVVPGMGMHARPMARGGMLPHMLRMVGPIRSPYKMVTNWHGQMVPVPRMSKATQTTSLSGAGDASHVADRSDIASNTEQVLCLSPQEMQEGYSQYKEEVHLLLFLLGLDKLYQMLGTADTRTLPTNINFLSGEERASMAEKTAALQMILRQLAVQLKNYSHILDQIQELCTGEKKYRPRRGTPESGRETRGSSTSSGHSSTTPPVYPVGSTQLEQISKQKDDSPEKPQGRLSAEQIDIVDHSTHRDINHQKTDKLAKSRQLANQTDIPSEKTKDKQSALSTFEEKGDESAISLETIVGDTCTKGESHQKEIAQPSESPVLVTDDQRKVSDDDISKYAVGKIPISSLSEAVADQGQSKEKHVEPLDVRDISPANIETKEVDGEKKKSEEDSAASMSKGDTLPLESKKKIAENPMEKIFEVKNTPQGKKKKNKKKKKKGNDNEKAEDVIQEQHVDVKTDNAIPDSWEDICSPPKNIKTMSSRHEKKSKKMDELPKLDLNSEESSTDNSGESTLINSQQIDTVVTACENETNSEESVSTDSQQPITTVVEEENKAQCVKTTAGSITAETGILGEDKPTSEQSRTTDEPAISVTAVDPTSTSSTSFSTCAQAEAFSCPGPLPGMAAANLAMSTLGTPGLPVGVAGMFPQAASIGMPGLMGMGMGGMMTQQPGFSEGDNQLLQMMMMTLLQTNPAFAANPALLQLTAMQHMLAMRRLQTHAASQSGLPALLPPTDIPVPAEKAIGGLSQAPDVAGLTQAPDVGSYRGDPNPPQSPPKPASRLPRTEGVAMKNAVSPQRLHSDLLSTPAVSDYVPPAPAMVSNKDTNVHVAESKAANTSDLVYKAATQSTNSNLLVRPESPSARIRYASENSLDSSRSSSPAPMLDAKPSPIAHRTKRVSQANALKKLLKQNEVDNKNVPNCQPSKTENITCNPVNPIVKNKKAAALSYAESASGERRLSTGQVVRTRSSSMSSSPCPSPPPSQGQAGQQASSKRVRTRTDSDGSHWAGLDDIHSVGSYANSKFVCSSTGGLSSLKDVADSLTSRTIERKNRNTPSEAGRKETLPVADSKKNPFSASSQEDGWVTAKSGRSKSNQLPKHIQQSKVKGVKKRERQNPKGEVQMASTEDVAVKQFHPNLKLTNSFKFMPEESGGQDCQGNDSDWDDEAEEYPGQFQWGKW